MSLAGSIIKLLCALSREVFERYFANSTEFDLRFRASLRLEWLGQNNFGGTREWGNGADGNIV